MAAQYTTLSLIQLMFVFLDNWQKKTLNELLGNNNWIFFCLWFEFPLSGKQSCYLNTLWTVNDVPGKDA